MIYIRFNTPEVTLFVDGLELNRITPPMDKLNTKFVFRMTQNFRKVLFGLLIILELNHNRKVSPMIENKL